MRWIVLIALLCVQFASRAQERSLEISTDRESMLIGEQMTMTVVMKGAASDTMILPLIEDTLITQIEVLERSIIDTSFEGTQLEQRILKQSFTITSFDSGYFPISPRIGIINGDTIASNPFLIAVQTIDIDTAKGIIDIMEIEEVPFSLKEWLQENWTWIAIAIALIALITFVVFKLSQKKPKPEKEIVVPTKPAFETALERLDKLHEEKLWQAGKIKAYYSKLSYILREYIEFHFFIPALEQTTDEIIRSLRHNPEISVEQIGKVKQLLFLSDLVKFAKESPVGSENELNFSIVKRFVEVTSSQQNQTTENHHG